MKYCQCNNYHSSSRYNPSLRQLRHRLLGPSSAEICAATAKLISTVKNLEEGLRSQQTVVQKLRKYWENSDKTSAGLIIELFEAEEKLYQLQIVADNAKQDITRLYDNAATSHGMNSYILWPHFSGPDKIIRSWYRGSSDGSKGSPEMHNLANYINKYFYNLYYIKENGSRYKRRTDVPRNVLSAWARAVEIAARPFYESVPDDVRALASADLETR